MFGRLLESRWARQLTRPYVHVVFGARQTGKTTLLRRLLGQVALSLDFSQPGLRTEYLRDPDRLIQLCRAMPRRRGAHVILIDEAQNVPSIFDAVQHLYDTDKKRWRFVLCGSSARKLRTTGANLLPGRALLHHLYPLTTAERPFTTEERFAGEFTTPLPVAMTQIDGEPKFPATSLIDRLTYGELPAVAAVPARDRADVLRSYTTIYLEEEIRREALVKDWAVFARFLQLAASESGQMLNYAKISKDAGVTIPTIKNYYQLLEDMFIGFRVMAFTGSPRKSLLSTERFFFFDVGVRNAAAELPLTPATVRANPGPVFEQWVGTELWKRLEYRGSGRLAYLRSKGGAEVDFIIQRDRRLVPIEVKWTENPSLHDARHLLAFLNEHPKQAQRGYVICRCRQPLALSDTITALPYFCL